MTCTLHASVRLASVGSMNPMAILLGNNKSKDTMDEGGGRRRKQRRGAGDEHGGMNVM
jgi:hypothetical protein